jgi:L-seryl-tRNA(Ser) seleniumtransferase
MNKQKAFAALPSVEKLLQTVEAEDLPHELKKSEIQDLLNAFRHEISKGSVVDIQSIEDILRERCRSISNSLRPVINGTGVVIHTNLGRAPFSSKMLARLEALSDGYVNLELDLNSGKRGSRHDHLRPWIKSLTGAADGILVNNNAAAVLLALNSLAYRKEVIISRGQLVEIGGSFRIPEILKKAGSKLVEVGTTNRTHIGDYEDAITERTKLLLWVHSSNYKISGFTKEVPVADLVSLGRKHNIPVMADLGSGALVPIDQYGLKREPLVPEISKLGVDVITFSVDKLLAGPQGGIIAGDKQLIGKIEKNHLLRALRPDKSQILLVMEALRAFVNADSIHEATPVYRDFTTDPVRLAERVAQIISSIQNKNITLSKIETRAEVGSGASPSETMPSIGLAIRHNNLSPSKLSKKLRLNEPAILGRIKDDIFILDFKAIREVEDRQITQALTTI